MVRDIKLIKLVRMCPIMPLLQAGLQSAQDSALPEYLYFERTDNRRFAFIYFLNY